MEERIANVEKVSVRVGRESELTQHLAYLYSQNEPVIRKETKKLQELDKRIIKNATREALKKRIKEHEEKRQRQEERQIKRLVKEAKERKRQKALEILKEQWENEQQKKDDDTESKTRSRKRSGSKKGSRDKGSKSASRKGSRKPSRKEGAQKSSKEEKREDEKKKKSRTASNASSKSASKTDESKKRSKDSKAALGSSEATKSKSEAKEMKFPDCFTEAELNRRLEDVMSYMGNPPIPPPPKSPSKRWTDEQWDAWLENCDQRPLFASLHEKADAEGIPEVDYLLKAFDLNQKLNDDISAVDDYFTEKYMKQEPVEEFESEVTSNLPSLVTEEKGKPEEHFPLTDLTKQERALQLKQEVVQEKSKREEELERKLQGLQEVKRHMDQERRIFLCHKDVRDHRKKIHRDNLAKHLLQNLGIDYMGIPETSNCVVEKYLKLQKERKLFEHRQVERRIEILKRLLAEEKKKQNLQKATISDETSLPVAKHPKTKLDISKQPHDIQFIDPVWVKSTLTPEQDVENITSFDEDYEEEDFEEEEIEERKSSTGKKKKKGKKNKSRTLLKKSQESLGKKRKVKSAGSKLRGSKKSSKTKKRKTRSTKESSIEPDVEREYVKPDDMALEDIDLYKSCDELQGIVSAYKESSAIICTPDMPVGFSWKPAQIEFKNFRSSNVYRQKVIVTNVSTQWLSCYMQEMELNDSLEIGSFELKNMYPQRICAGLSFDFTVIFKPTSRSLEEIKGKIYFIASSDENVKPECFSIPILCTPMKREDLLPRLIPKEIRFIDVPEWGNVQEKILKIFNSSDINYSASIARPTTKKPEQPTDFQKSNTSIEKKSKKRKKKKDQSKVNTNSIDQLTELLINECLEAISEIFRIEPRHYIYIPAQSTTSVKILFKPRPAGNFFDEYIVTFEDADMKLTYQTALCISAITIPFPVSVEPTVVSFNTCLFDCAAYQAHFSVINSSGVAVKLTANVPKELHNQAQIIPYETYVQPVSSSSFTVRLTPKYKLQRNIQKYYKPDIEILDFPAFIHPIHKTFGNSPTLSIQILAVLTSPYALEVTPSFCNLGVVSTQETVCKKFSLINKSNAWLHYAFLNTPESVQIQPNYGLGFIGPREHRKLHLLYSPKATDIEGNKAFKRCGISGFHKFYVQVVSDAMQAGIDLGHGKSAGYAMELIRKEYVKDFLHTQCEPIQKRKTVPIDDTESVFSNIPSEDKLFTTNTELKDGVTTYDMSKAAVIDAIIQEKINGIKSKPKTNPSLVCMTDFIQATETKIIDTDDASEDSFEDEEHSYNLTEESSCKNVLLCQAYVIDPLCELSHTRLVLPATPCGSFTLSSFYLYAYNKVSNPDCQCGLLSSWSEKIKNFQARFEFHSSYQQLSIEPNCGHFSAGQDVKITAVFKPVLPRHAVEAQARRLRAQILTETTVAKDKEEAEAKETKKKKKAGKKGRGTSEKKKKTKGSKDRSTKGKDKKKKTEERSLKEDEDQKTIKPGKDDLAAEDILTAEKSILEMLEPFCVRAKVKCLVEILHFNDANSSRCEVHRMEILCPVVKPNIIVLGTTHHVKFGPVAKCIRSCQLLRVQNMNQENIQVSATLLNPLGPFTCPFSETTVAPEHVLLLPITFCPFQETKEVAEFFEIRSGKTIIPIKISGEGVIPNYLINPDFLVYRFDYKKSTGKNKESCLIEIQNTCAADLPFTIVQELVAQAEIKDEPATATDVPTKGNEGKRSAQLPRDTPAKGDKKETKDVSNIKKVKGGDSIKGSTLKGGRLKKYDNELQPDEVTILSDNVCDMTTFQSPFQAGSGTGETEIVIRPKETASFEVTFILPVSTIDTNGDKSIALSVSQPKDQNRSSKSKKRDSRKRSQSESRMIRKKSRPGSTKGKETDIKGKKGRNDELMTEDTAADQPLTEEKKFQYAAKFSLLLGKTMNVRDFFFTASPKAKIEALPKLTSKSKRQSSKAK